MSTILGKLREVKEVSSFILGGKSEFTIKNMNNGKQYKYKVTKSKKKKGMYFVRVFQHNSYVYAGFLNVSEKSIYYGQGVKGTLDDESEPIKGLIWALNKGNRPLPSPMVMYHHGKCACCGKTLTDEESIIKGFGPVCWKELKRQGVLV